MKIVRGLISYKHAKTDAGYNLEPNPISRGTLRGERALKSHSNDNKNPRDDVLGPILAKCAGSGPCYYGKWRYGEAVWQHVHTTSKW